MSSTAETEGARVRFVIPALVAAVFVVDSFTPRGTTVWMGYLLPLVLAGGRAARFRPHGVAAVCSILIVTGFFVSPPGVAVSLAVRNRAMGIGMLWLVAHVLARSRAREDLRLAGEERYRATLARVSDAFVALDREWRCTYANARAGEVLGRRPEDLIGRPFWSESPTGAENELRAACERALAEQRPDRRQSRFPGGERWFETGIYPSADGVSLYSQDITARKAAETALRETDTRLRLAVAAANVGLWDWHLATNAVYFSREWKAQLGYAEHEIADRFEEWERRVHPDDLAPTLAKVQAFVAQPGAEYSTEFRLRHRDGTWRWMLTQAQILREADGRTARMLGSHIDITQRKEAEARQIEGEQRMRLATEATEVGIWEWHVGSGRIRWDAQMFRIYGIAPTPDGCVHYRDWSAAVRPAELARQEQILQDTVRHGGRSARQFGIRRQSDGLEREIHAVEVSRRGVGGAVEWVVGANLDITERRQAETQLRESREQLRALLAKLQLAREEERLQVSREVHDELGQILTGLKMEVRGIEAKLSEPDVPPALRAVLDRAVGASELADAALAVVKQVAEQLRPAALDKLGLAAALAQELRRGGERGGFRGRLAEDETAAAVPAAVATELFYIGREAITNIVRHAQATCVEVGLRRDGPWLVLTVTDDGVGLPPPEEVRQRSLGLLGMAERAAQCGGSLSLDANVPRGTRVTVRVPNQPREAGAAGPTL